MPRSLYGYSPAQPSLIMPSELGIPDTQRALVLQGGAALGAYEAGVLRTLIRELSKEDEANDKKRDGLLFDIIAGTSAGAINAAVLVSYFINNHKNWSGVETVLEDFWRYISAPTPYIAKVYQASLGESARRYYSAKYFFYDGVPNVFSISAFPELDHRFYDYLPYFNYRPNTNPNLGFHYNNDRLFDSLGTMHRSTGDRYANSHILTRFENGEPRLLVVSTNVKEGRSSTFDSYSDKGINMKHLKASAAVPVYFEYVDIDGEKFCDGGILSNTPLRELIQYHRDYWLDYVDKQLSSVEKTNVKVPDLEIYVINVWPTREDSIQLDHDGVKDRRNDILYSDKTEYDQKVAVLVSDYVDLALGLQAIANKAIGLVQDNAEKDRLQEELTKILETMARSEGRTPPLRRKLQNLIKGRFDLNKVVTIERTDDENNISDKWADYSLETIDQLIMEGEQYTSKAKVRIIPHPDESSTGYSSP
jgi:predicted acylesterase/phospholipase RssA